MPQALALALPSVFAAGGSVALFTAAGTLTLAGAGASIATSIGLSALSRTLAGRNRPAALDPDTIKLNLKQSIGDRIVHIGRVVTGGTVVFFRASEGKLYRVIVHGHGEVDAFEAFILADKPVSLEVGVTNDVSDPQYEVDGRRLVQIDPSLGTPVGSPFTQIEAVWPDWDADHRLDGLVTTLTVAEAPDAETFATVYPQREPSLRVRLRGRKLRDPRGATAWSDNAALAIAHLIEDPDVFGLAGAVDDTQLALAAEDCDDGIPLLSGGTEPRWRIWGSYALTERPTDILQRMLKVCAADIALLPNGKIGIYPDKWRAPTVTLTRAELIEIVEWTDGPDILDRYTELPFTYVSPELGYTATSGDPWVDAAREAAEGRILTGPEQDFGMCPSGTQGRRAAQVMIERDNPGHTLVARWKPSAKRACRDRFIALDVAEITAVFAGAWRVMSYEVNLGDGSVTFGLSSYVPPTWSTALEGTPVVLPDPNEEGTIPVPTEVKAYGFGQGGSPGIGAIWLKSGYPGLAPELQYSLAGDADWTAWPLASGANSARIAPLEAEDYDIRVRFNTADGLHGAWVQRLGITALTSTSAPAAPTLLAVSDDTGGVAEITLTTSASASLWRTQVLRDGVVIANDYAGPGTAITISDPSGAGTFDWTARSVSTGKKASAIAGPITRTIT